jgi:hypothetical protein
MPSLLGFDFTETINNKSSVIRNYQVIDGKAVISLFQNGQFSPYPTLANASSGSVEKIKNVSEIHSDDANDISISSIIAYTNETNEKGQFRTPAMKLNYSHFAYLKDVGVLPCNRLIIARRFSAGVGNDLTALTSEALSTIVGYYSDAEDVLSIKFNEVYTDAEGSFEEVLNQIGEDVITSIDNKTKSAGSMAGGLFNLIPLPGITEGLQLEALNALGLSGEGQGSGASPLGNPNLIREARRRQVPGKGEAGSALSCEFNIKLVVEYEQKFINGVDPTLVYFDIIQNALTFGTSDAAFQFSAALAGGANKLIANLISGDINAIISSITQFVSKLINLITDRVTKLLDAIIKELEESGESDEKKEEESDEDAEEGNKNQAEIDAAKSIKDSVIKLLGEAVKTTLGTVISRYKVRLVGIANALTGSPSTPWHVTIGNPKKPWFTSGDLECTSVNVTMGKMLAFNDLPSSIKIEIDLKNARNLGAQEIFNRFNSGRGRSYVRANKSFVETPDALIQQEVKRITDEENKKKDAETQAKAPTQEKKAETNQTTDETKKATDEQNTSIPIPVDSYVVSESKFQSKYEWGTTQPLPPPNQVKTGDDTTPVITSTVETKPSQQSANDPNVTTSAIPPGSTAAPAPTQQTPGAQPIGSTQSPAVVLPTNPQASGASASTLNGTVSVSNDATASPPPPENVTPTPKAASTEWRPGKKVSSGSFNQQGISTEWTLKQGDTPGNYVGSWQSSGGVYGDTKVRAISFTQSVTEPNPKAGQPITEDSDEIEYREDADYAREQIYYEAQLEFEARIKAAGLKLI